MLKYKIPQIVTLTPEFPQVFKLTRSFCAKKQKSSTNTL